ncbi:thioredoxin family protein [Gloeobacter morelensis]|uniref:Thioredoxin family protein n=1 Tax=Gloeobacter morelensis MG652769 TaxID=2781736 RepID=A0ABY3PR86_9CYAN|nr:thioredoxin family protein [Gloeobacter morelensis]UFP96124.1 thioredoxin family protein [Gloeobacter morelensis MG652769]
MESASENKTGIWLRNGIVALASVLIAVLVFFAARNQAPSMQQLAAEAVPLDEALANGKPTLVEFYADWCASCQTMAPTIARLKERYGEQANFVMLNVDNPRWLPELQQYKVSGIPHYAFLDAAARPLGSAIGLQPSQVLEDNLTALAAGAETLPKAGTPAGQTSKFTPPKKVDQPRDHS